MLHVGLGVGGGRRSATESKRVTREKEKITDPINNKRDETVEVGHGSKKNCKERRDREKDRVRAKREKQRELQFKETPKKEGRIAPRKRMEENLKRRGEDEMGR